MEANNAELLADADDVGVTAADTLTDEDDDVESVAVKDGDDVGTGIEALGDGDAATVRDADTVEGADAMLVKDNDAAAVALWDACDEIDSDDDAESEPVDDRDGEVEAVRDGGGDNDTEIEPVDDNDTDPVGVIATD